MTTPVMKYSSLSPDIEVSSFFVSLFVPPSTDCIIGPVSFGFRPALQIPIDPVNLPSSPLFTSRSDLLRGDHFFSLVPVLVAR